MGPNGSGKSNIVDAVRWALGEQSMRDLRGKRSEDVIYGGPRRSLGAAEVVLTFEDALGQEVGLGPAVEIDQWPEVSLSRRLYRSGESEYLANGQKVRLRDLLGVLRAIGIDAGHHVIVNQGMADALLAATPIERRGLLEQAAGLAPYRDKREEARRKLSTINQNIETAQIVLSELEPRLRLLRRQAKAVEEREAVLETLNSRVLEWFGVKWRAMEEKRKVLATQLEAAASSREEAADELERLESEAETALQAERDWHQSLEVIRASLNIAERERDALRLDVDHLRQRATIGERVFERHGEQASQLELAIEDASRRKETAENALNELRVARLAEERRQPSARSILSSLSEELAQAQQRKAERQMAIRKVQEELAQASEKAMKTKGSLAERRHALRLIETRLKEAADSLSASEHTFKQLHEDLAQVIASERKALAEAEDAGREFSLQQSRHQRVNAARSRARGLCAQAEIKLDSAKSSLSQLSPEVNTTVIESLKIRKGWERAIAAALGSWSEASGASLEVELREADESGFLKWRDSLSRVVDGYWADVYLEERSSPLRRLLIGTLLVEDDQRAAATWREIASLPAFQVGSPLIQIVSRSGDRWSSLGVRRYRGDDLTGRYLSARAELSRLLQCVAVRRRRLERLEEKERAEQELCRTREEADQAARKDLILARTRRDEVSLERERLERATAHLKAEHQEGLARFDQVRSSIEELEGQMQTLIDVETAFEDELESLRAETEAADQLSQEVEEKVCEASEKARLARQAHETLVAREATHVETMQLAQLDIDRLSAELESHLDDRHRLGLEKEVIEGEIVRASQRLEALEEVIADQFKRLAAVRDERPVVEQSELLREIRGRHLQLVGSHERLVAAFAQVEVERDNLRAEMWREVGMEPAFLTKESETPPTDDEIRRLRQRALQYADADESAVTEFQELAERQEYLTAHLEDLNGARENVTEIMRVADSEMRTRFGAAFEAVSDEFGRVFQIMLRGGSARLEQIDDEGAVEILAQLPGRKPFSSHAFSGGERALVASSLLFGVLRIRPAPFCILDEVDAPLDESNVDRYLNVLRELSQNTQMIVVTHNRATMAAADALYGLTMDDEGVSNLLSLRLDAYKPAV